MFGWIITLVVALPFVVLAVFLFRGKGAFLIAGFNTMSDSKKAEYDEKALSKAVGKLLLVLALLMFLFPLAISLEAMWLFWVSFALFMVVTFGFVIYANTGNRFRKAGAGESVEGAAERNPMTKGIKIAVIIGIVFSVLILAGIGIMFYFGEKDPNVSVGDGYVKIDAMYGLTVNFSDIKEVNLFDRNMHDIGIGRRTNGYGGFGQALKGNFSSAENGTKLLFVYADSAPTIHIVRTAGADIFISYRNSETTRTIYSQITSAVS